MRDVATVADKNTSPLRLTVSACPGDLTCRGGGHPVPKNQPVGIQAYFTQTRQIGLCAADDGALVANMLMDRLTAVKKISKVPVIVSKFVARTAMLRDCHFANIGTMLLAIVLHELENVAVVDPAAFTIEHARTIGRGFGAIVLGNSIPEAVVGEFALTYPSMRKIDHEYMWFWPMIEVIAARRMESAPLGLKMRVGVGATLSFGDVI